MGHMEEITINKNPIKWQLCKAETNCRLPEGIIEKQHNFQGVFVLKLRSRSMGGSYQKCQVT